MSKLPPRTVLASAPSTIPASIMPDFSDDALQERAWCVATFDAATGKLLRANIYSSPARGLTSNMRDECMLEGPSAMGRSYEEARRGVEKLLKESPTYRWLYRAVRDYETRTGLKEFGGER